VRAGDVRASHAVLAIGSVALATGFHWFWSLGVCMDDSGSLDRTYLETCWTHDSGSRGGWEPEAIVVFLGPVAVVVVSAVAAAAMRLPVILPVGTALSLVLVVVGFFTAPLNFG
jgi:hypothetical protein